MKRINAIALVCICILAFSCSSAPSHKDLSVDMHPYQDFEKFRDKVLKFAYTQGSEVSDYYEEIYISDVKGYPDRMTINAYIGSRDLRLDSTTRYYWKEDALISESWVYYGENNEKRPASLPDGGYVVFPAFMNEGTRINRSFTYSVYNSQFGWLNYSAQMGLKYGGKVEITIMGSKIEAVVVEQDITWTITTDSGVSYGPNRGTWYYYYAKPFGYVRGDFSNSDGRTTIMELKEVMTHRQFESVKRTFIK